MGGVSGLSTLLSGAYIGLEPGDGEPRGASPASRTAADQLERARPRVRADRVPGVGQPGRSHHLPRRRRRPGAGLRAHRGRAGTGRHHLRRGALPSAGALREPLLEHERHRHPRRDRRLRRARRLAPGAAGRRHRVRHATGRRASEVAAAGATFPLFASEQAVAQAQYTEKIPLPGLFRRFGPRPQPRRARGVPGLARRLGHRRPTGFRPHHQPYPHPGHARDRAAAAGRLRPRAPDRDREPPHHDRAGPPGLRAQLQTGNLLTGG